MGGLSNGDFRGLRFLEFTITRTTTKSSDALESSTMTPLPNTPKEVCERLAVIVGYFGNQEDAAVWVGGKPAKRKHPLVKAIVALGKACADEDYPAVGQAIRDIRKAWKTGTSINGKKRSAVRQGTDELFPIAQAMPEFEYEKTK
jgi:hypothetical protein